MSARVYIGTSGWDYKDWKPSFYPDDLPHKKRLDHFGTQFDTVEVNGSFYKFPEPHMVEGWVAHTPSDFRLAFKMYRGVTHYRKLTNSRRYLDDYFRAVGKAPVRQRGPVLVQLPGNQGPDLERLDAFLQEAKAAARPQRWKLAVEFRHEGWLDGETGRDTRALLDTHHTALVAHDMTGGTNEPNDGPSFVYFRRHGPGGDHSKGYTKKAIEADAARVRTWRADGRTVFVYYNNDVGAHAPQDAARLSEAVAS